MPAKKVFFVLTLFLSTCNCSLSLNLSLSEDFVEHDLNPVTYKEKLESKTRKKQEIEANEECIVNSIESFRKGGSPSKEELFALVYRAGCLFADETDIVSINIEEGTNLVIVGDLHASLEDLLKILELNGTPSPKKKYLFNGDFVDKGNNSVEVIALLLMYKLVYPKDVFLTRGNHETESISKHYGFYQELDLKYQIDANELFEAFNFLFNSLPLAYVVQEKIFVCHGGIPDFLIELSHMKNSSDRFSMLEKNELLVNLLWNDPQQNEGFTRNQKRGIGYCFGPDKTNEFLDSNGLSLLIRSHESCSFENAYSQNGKCLTVFSSSDDGTVHEPRTYVIVDSNASERLLSYSINETSGEANTENL